MNEALPDVLLEAPFAELWQDKDVFIEVERLQGIEYRALEGRRTFRTEVSGRGYFVKIHRGVGWGEIIKNLVSLRLPILGAHNEFAAVHCLAKIGVPSMHPVAFAQRGRNPATRHSFLITEELAPTISLDQAWPSAELALSRRQRSALVARVADMTRRMHSAGLNHRDLYLCHFLLHTDVSPDEAKLSLIDLHRAQLRTSVPRRWRDKDLAALYFSALEAGVSYHDCLRFLRDYFCAPLRDVFKNEARVLNFLRRKSARLQRRYERKYAPGVVKGSAP